ncbi:hypothetical protein Taro_018083 [Colocasia esculenta]|uniref:Formamidopyrimidine-DNA glycosylase catalytic domain-containing protein n=1 Tax=Colocasia esculenta TaxID=4460 RepID=A0A843UY33_COLES|nr:hypothetical protein [Colocasia esculenta]
MPELPEVEAARRAVEEHCVGKRIKRAVVADDPKVIEGVTPADFEAALVGKAVLQALRKGKNLWLRLDSPPFPSFQFGRQWAPMRSGPPSIPRSSSKYITHGGEDTRARTRFDPARVYQRRRPSTAATPSLWLGDEECYF